MGHQDRPKPDLRETAIDVVRVLSEAGHTAYFAGGCVRDRLMGHAPDDYDIATDARPNQVAELFHNAQFVGESFGVMLVRRRGHLVHVATFRTDGDYSDGRHPDSVSFTDAQADAARRDFTINGLFEDPIAEAVIDHVGGQDDLARKLVRAIGDPAARLREDALRSLRAVRFAARFEFQIEEATAQAIRAAAADLRGVSRERIGDELKRMLSHPNRAIAAWTLQYLGLDRLVLDEPHQDTAPQRMGRLPEDARYPTALAAWLLDRHEDDPRGPDAPGLMVRARAWASGLLLSNAEQVLLRETLAIHDIVGSDDWSNLGVAAQKRLAARREFAEALVLMRATDAQRFVDVQRHVQSLAATGLAPTPFVSGEDLIGMGLSPGPIFKQVLDAVYDAQLEGGIRDRDQALTMARILVGDPDG